MNMFISNRKDLNSLDKVNGLAVVGGFSLVIISHLLRPLPITTPQAIKICIGSLPNFGSGIGLPFVIRVLINSIMAYYLPRKISFMGICIVSLGLLVGWEYISFAFWAITPDLNDLLASIIGVIVALIVNRLGSKRGNNNNNQ